LHFLYFGEKLNQGVVKYTIRVVAEKCKAALFLRQLVPLAFRTVVGSGPDMDELREMLWQPSLITGEDARTGRAPRVQSPDARARLRVQCCMG
jgi:hypothetical protein